MTRILLIEDNKMNRDMLSRRLQDQGHGRQQKPARCSTAVCGVPQRLGTLIYCCHAEIQRSE